MKACQNYQKNPKRKSAEIAIQGVPQPIATSRKSAKKNPPPKKKGTDVIIDLTSKRSMFLYFFFDLETTGFSRNYDEIVEIAIKTINNKFECLDEKMSTGRHRKSSDRTGTHRVGLIICSTSL